MRAGTTDAPGRAEAANLTVEDPETSTALGISERRVR